MPGVIKEGITAAESTGPELDPFRDLKTSSLPTCRSGTYLAEGVETVLLLLASATPVDKVFVHEKRLDELRAALEASPYNPAVYPANKAGMEKAPPLTQAPLWTPALAILCHHRQAPRTRQPAPAAGPGCCLRPAPLLPPPLQVVGFSVHKSMVVLACGPAPTYTLDDLWALAASKVRVPSPCPLCTCLRPEPNRQLRLLGIDWTSDYENLG
eukprot:gene4282-4569_t